MVTIDESGRVLSCTGLNCNTIWSRDSHVDLFFYPWCAVNNRLVHQVHIENLSSMSNTVNFPKIIISRGRKKTLDHGPYTEGGIRKSFQSLQVLLDSRQS